MRVLLQHNEQWLCFEQPKKILQTTRLEEVLPLLEEAEHSNLFAAGWVSYESAPTFDSALQTHSNPSFPLLCFGLFSAPIVLDHLEAVSPFKLGEQTPTLSKNAYIKKIEQIKREIAAGATYQVNYTHALHSSFHGDPFSFFATLVHGQKTRHAAFIQTDDFSICSASPELFFHQKGDEITMRPMKGTARRGLTPEQDLTQYTALQHSQKDRAENVMIVDMVRNDLGRIAIPGSISVENPFKIEKYPTVWQMISTIKAELKSSSLSTLFKNLFPCASITGAPKAKTMEIIKSLEPNPRNIYTGVIGFAAPNNQESCFNVAIRTALIHHKQNKLEYGVGGGIVWDSQPESEWEETQSKALILTRPQPDFQLIETMLWEPKIGLFLEQEHIHRIQKSAGYFDIPFHFDQLEKQLHQTINQLKKQSHKIRLLLHQNGTFSIKTSPFNPTQKSCKITLAKNPNPPVSSFLFHKTTQRDLYEKAKADFPEFDDVILWNTQGEITESCIANIVIQQGDQLFTPPLKSGLLPGTFRAHLLKTKAIQEKTIPIEELKTADEIYLINALRKWRPATLL